MRAWVDGKREIGLSIEDPVGGAESLESLPADRHGETSGRLLLLAQFAHQGARGNTGEDVGELEVLFQAGEVEARAMAVLHVGDGRKPSAATCHLQALIKSGDIHGGLATQRKAGDGEAVGVHLRKRDNVVQAAQGVPDAFPHERPVRVLEFVLADVGRNNDITPLDEFAAIPIRAGAMHDLLAAASVTI